MKKYILMLSMMVLSTAAYSKGCETPKNAFDEVYCEGNLFAQNDKDLNVAYADLRKQLNSDGKEKLKKGQLAWIRERNDECSYEKPSGYFVNLSCANQMTEERLAFLKARSRECASTGCEISRLAGE